jgi:ABC-2 type transport system permease protein
MKSRSVWTTLLRFDLLTQLRERGTWLLLAGVVAVAWFGLWQGVAFTRAVEASAASASAQQVAAMRAAAEYAKAFFAEPDKLAHREARSFRNVADIRGYAFREHIAFAVKPAAPGAALAIGQADLLPRYVRVRAESMDSVRNASEIDHPKRLAVGRFDLAFVVLYLWPLVLLAVCISALTADRETRRMEGLRLQGVSATQVLLAQVLGRCALLTLAFVKLVALAAFVFGAVPLSAAGLLAIASWVGVVMLYSAFWAGVAALVAALCATRAVAAFVAFAAWVVVAVVIPQLLVAVIATSSPLPSREAYLLAQREAVDKVNADRDNMVQRFYDQHPAWRPQTTPLNKVAAPVVRFARAAALERAMAATEAKFDTARANQAAWLGAMQWLSPVTVAQMALSHIAGSDAARHDAFMGEVRLYQVALRDFFQVRLQQAALANEVAPCMHPSTTCLPGFGFVAHADVPVFAASESLRATALPLAVAWLAAWCVLLLWFATRLATTGARPMESRHTAIFGAA